MSKILAAGFALQMAVAAWQLTQPRPARFGWQMYAGLSQPTSFTVITPDGERAVDLGGYLAQPRGDLDLIAILPSAVCAREPKAVAIRFRVIPERQPRSVPCSR